MNYAVIKNGIVSNIVWLSPYNAMDFPDAVPTDGIPVQIGDTYETGGFYRDGERVLSEMEMLQEELADQRSALELLGVTVDG